MWAVLATFDGDDGDTEMEDAGVRAMEMPGSAKR
jgi:hypothetical protein